MSKNTYPNEQVQFVQTVSDMMDAQRDFFTQPSDYRKKIAMAWEAKVRALLEPYKKAGIVQPRAKASNNAPKLF